MALIFALIPAARSAAPTASTLSSFIEHAGLGPDDEVLLVADGPDALALAHPRVEVVRPAAPSGFPARANAALRRAGARGCGAVLLDGASGPGSLDAVDRAGRAVGLSAGPPWSDAAGASWLHVPLAAQAALGRLDEGFVSPRAAVEDYRLRALKAGIDVRQARAGGGRPKAASGAASGPAAGPASPPAPDRARFADLWGEALRSLFLDADDVRPAARALGVEGLVDRNDFAELVRRYAPPGPDDRRWVKPPRRRLCFHAVVQDGGAELERCLRSAADHVAYWVIADAGSADGTPETVERFFAERGIPGELHHLPPGLGDRARGEALARARASPLPYDYLLLMDADTALDVEDGGFGLGLDAPAYRLRGPGGAWAPRLIGRDTFGDYRPDHGGAFEVRSVAVQNLSGARLVRESEADPGEAAAQHAALDRRDLDRAGRTAGRVARIARDGARQRPADAGSEVGWRGLMRDARVLAAAGRGEEALDLAVSAFAARPRRAEPLCLAAVHLRLRGFDEAAAAVAALGLELARRMGEPGEPGEAGRNGDGLAEALMGELTGELSLAAFSCASPERRAEGFRACDALSMSRGATVQRRFEARRDLFFYAGRLHEIAGCAASHRLALSPEPGWRAMNPSVALWKGELWACLRLVNYGLEDSYYSAPEGKPFITRNLLARLDGRPDGRLGIAALSEVLPPEGQPAPLCSVALGFEDMRLIPLGDELWCSSSIKEMNADGWCEQALARIEGAEGAGPCRLADLGLMRAGEPSGQPAAHQKNWTAQVADSELRFIHTYALPCGESLVVSRTGAALRRGEPEGWNTAAAREHLRGGSQALPFRGGWLAVCHEVVFIGIRRCYLHRFAWFDADTRLARLSLPFRFGERDVEFVAGLAVHPDGSRFVVSYGVADCEAWLATVPIPAVGRILGFGDEPDA